MDIRKEINKIREDLETPGWMNPMFEKLKVLVSRYEAQNFEEQLSTIRTKHREIRKLSEFQEIDYNEYLEQFEGVVASINKLISAIEKEHQRIYGNKCKPGSEITKINCNRKWVLHTFEEAFNRKKAANYPIHFYFLGEDEKGHVKADSLVKRLIIKLRDDLSRENQTIKYPGFKKLQPTIIDILPGFELNACCGAFRKAFCKKTFPEINDLQQFTQKNEEKFYSKDHYIPFVFKVKAYPESWEQFVLQSIEWFIQKFCRIEDLPKHRILFFFILHVRKKKWSTKDQKRNSWLSFFKTSKAQKTNYSLDIYEEMERFTQDHVTILPQLNSVSVEDLKDWFEENDYVSKEEHTLEDLIKNLVDQLGGGDQWNMSDVEKRLEVIVNRHQNVANNI